MKSVLCVRCGTKTRSFNYLCKHCKEYKACQICQWAETEENEAQEIEDPNASHLAPTIDSDDDTEIVSIETQGKGISRGGPANGIIKASSECVMCIKCKGFSKMYHYLCMDCKDYKNCEKCQKEIDSRSQYIIQDSEMALLQSAVQSNSNIVSGLMKNHRKDSRASKNILKELKDQQTQDRMINNTMLNSLIEEQKKDHQIIADLTNRVQELQSTPECPLCPAITVKLTCNHFSCPGCHRKEGKLYCPVCQQV